MTAREFPGDTPGRSRHGVVATYAVYVGGEDTFEHADARIRDSPFATKAAAIEAGRLHATPGETITVWKVDPEASEGAEWTRVFYTHGGAMTARTFTPADVEDDLREAAKSGRVPL